MNRIIFKLIYLLSTPILRFIDYFSPRFYMKIQVFRLSLMGVKFQGVPRYISTKVKFDDFKKIHLGERVVISEEVILLTHDYSLTTGLISISNTPKKDVAFLKKIIIGNNVFVGMGSILLPGTVIGDNVIVGAGSVVRGKVPSDSIVVGNPAEVISDLTSKAAVWKNNMDNRTLRFD